MHHVRVRVRVRVRARVRVRVRVRVMRHRVVAVLGERRLVSRAIELYSK